MMHEADRWSASGSDAAASSTGPSSMPAGGLVLRGTHGPVKVRAWPGRPDLAHLVLYQQTAPPTGNDLERWCDELARRGFHAVRTSAIGPAGSDRVRRHGFVVVQELVLLQHDSPAEVPSPGRRTERLPVDQDGLAAALDATAFGPDWTLDHDALTDVRGATPRHRARVTRSADGTLTGYAVTGRDSRLGFLQRLAVHPDHRRDGLGRALVLDSLRWLGRWRVQRVLVNTPLDNAPALALYEGLGFHRLPEGLQVYERVLR